MKRGKNKRGKKVLRAFLIVLGVLLLITWFYTSSLIGVDPKTKAYYSELKKELKARGYKTRMFTISGRRWKLNNCLLIKGIKYPLPQHSLN